MKAFTKTEYGGPEVLNLEEVEKPKVKDGHVLVNVKANSANPADWHILRGEPYFARFSLGLFRPKQKILGADFAGIVEAVGKGIEHFKPGDRVFGETLEGGAFAEYICVPAKNCGLMPEGLSFTDMAAVPIAGVTALQALISHGELKSGESVFINGASGGVGHFAVQIAKVIGAEVTAVCSSGKAEFVESLGADRVVAYDQEDIHQHNGVYDLVLDNHGNLTHDDFTRLGKRGVLVGFTTISNMASVLLKNVFSKFPLAQFTAEANTSDLEILADMIQEEKISPFIEKKYSYSQIPEAISYIEDMHTKGKVVMSWEEG